MRCRVAYAMMLVGTVFAHNPYSDEKVAALNVLAGRHAACEYH
jgi:hypothetical protein